MRIFFCPECGAYSRVPASHCDECQAALPEDSWDEVTEEELHQLEHIHEHELPPGLPSWEYDVIKLRSGADGDGMVYNSEVLRGMGDKGWELVSILPPKDGETAQYGVFKRSWSPDYDE
jgi:hypothetical protein